MYKTVESYLEANGQSWSGIPAFGTSYTKFTDKLSQLKSQLLEEQTKLKATMQEKAEALEKCSIAASEIASILYAYASTINDYELVEQAKITKWSIRRNSKLKSLQNVDRAIQLATAHLSEAEDFGLTQEKIDLLMEHRDDLEAVLFVPRQLVLARKLQNISLKNSFKEVDRILKNQLDKLAHSLKSDAPQFYLGYVSARNVIEHGTRHTDENEGLTENESDGSSE